MTVTSPLKQVRTFLNLTQADVAKILGRTQGSVSKFEAGEVKLSTLQKVLEAKGGTLVVQAEFPDATYTLSI